MFPSFSHNTQKKVLADRLYTDFSVLTRVEVKIFSKNNGFRPFLSRYEESFPEKTLKHTVYNSRIFLYNKENVIVCTKLLFMLASVGNAVLSVPSGNLTSMGKFPVHFLCYGANSAASRSER